MSIQQDLKTPGFRLPVSAVAVSALIVAGAAFLFLTSTNSDAEEGKTPPSKAAAATPADSDPVVAVVNGEQIKRSEVGDFINGLPPPVRQQMPLEKLFPAALDQVVDNHIVAAKAAKANLADDPEVKKLVAQGTEQTIRSVYLQRQVNAQVTNQKLAAAYKDFLDKTANTEEVHAAEITVKSEDTAKEVIKKLEGGAKFADLAKEYSISPSSQNGGDLGYFTKDQMIPDIADAVFALDKGRYTKNAVKTQMGWDVIQVMDKRKKPQPDFDSVKPQLESDLRQQVLSDLIAQWKKESSIKEFDINGNPVKEAADEKKGKGK